MLSNDLLLQVFDAQIKTMPLNVGLLYYITLDECIGSKVKMIHKTSFDKKVGVITVLGSDDMEYVRTEDVNARLGLCLAYCNDVPIFEQS